MVNNKDIKHCPKCGRNLRERENFYMFKDGETTADLCKKCMTMHVDNENPATFMDLLEFFDVPYIPEQWLQIIQRQKELNPHRPLTGQSVFGRYLAKMRLTQYAKYTFADTEPIAEEARQRKVDAALQAKMSEDNPGKSVLQEMLDNHEITEEEFVEIRDAKQEEENLKKIAETETQEAYPINHPYEEISLPDIADSLTAEDKKYLAMKWGKFFRPDQWVWLESFYTKMMESFGVDDPAREDTLKKICKVSLQMDEALDAQDADKFKKLQKAYDELTKAGKFQEAQKKEVSSAAYNSIGEIVALVEKEGGFIPEYSDDYDQDKVDMTLIDMNNYVRKLVTQDLGLSQQIEEFMKDYKKIMMDSYSEEEEEAASENVEKGIFAELEQEVLTEADYIEYNQNYEDDYLEDNRGD